MDRDLQVLEKVLDNYKRLNNFENAVIALLGLLIKILIVWKLENKK